MYRDMSAFGIWDLNPIMKKMENQIESGLICGGSEE